MNTIRDRIRGSLIGGAIGDALGYPVEFFFSYERIQARYGERGIMIQHMADDLYQTRLSCGTRLKNNKTF